jgi:hypothetical protein
MGLGGNSIRQSVCFARLITMFAMLTSLTGCQSDPVHLRHPQTGEIKQCGPYDKTKNRTWEDAERECIKEFLTQGYKLPEKERSQGHELPKKELDY